MNVIKTFQDPSFLRAFHGWSTVFWIPFTVLALILGWLSSVVFVSLMSMLALLLSSWAAWQGARGEVEIVAQNNNEVNINVEGEHNE